MKGKVLFVVGLGVGYVLGTRAGRERYEQIRQSAQKLWNTPTVQQGVGTAKDFATTRVGDLSDTLLENLKGLIGTATRQSGVTKQDVNRAARSAKENISKAADAAKSAVDAATSKFGQAVDEASDVPSASKRTTTGGATAGGATSGGATAGGAGSGASTTSPGGGSSATSDA